MSEQSVLLVTASNQALSQRQIDHWFHVREAGKLSRRAFTEVIKAFCEYVDPQGGKSSDPKMAYMRMTTKLYSPLGLSSKVIHQLREIHDLNVLRDHMPSRVLFALSVLEEELSTWIDTAMKAKALRSVIKKHIDEEARKTADFCGVKPKDKKTTQRKAA